jgi:hypothetical chaperone protein
VRLRQAEIPPEMVVPGLSVAVGGLLAERIVVAQIRVSLAQARLSAGDIDAVFLTGR